MIYYSSSMIDTIRLSYANLFIHMKGVNTACIYIAWRTMQHECLSKRVCNLALYLPRRAMYYSYFQCDPQEMLVSL